MSKAFTKDDAWDEPVVAPRAPLPAGVPNYVTPRGLGLLRAELAALDADRQRLDAEREDEGEHRRRLAIINRRRSDLVARIARQAHDRVRFGARVTLKILTGERAGEEIHLEIVGVDEADAAHGHVAFVAPIARAIISREVGDTAPLDTARGEELLQVVAIEYAD